MSDSTAPEKRPESLLAPDAWDDLYDSSVSRITSFSEKFVLRSNNSSNDDPEPLELALQPRLIFDYFLLTSMLSSINWQKRA